MADPSVVAVFPHARVTSLQNCASDLECPLAADWSETGVQLPDMQKLQNRMLMRRMVRVGHMGAEF
jgi:hypothetical protein